MYTTSLERWKVYKEFLAPLLRPLRPLILDYERAAGLPSSAELLSQVGRAPGPLREPLHCALWVATATAAAAAA